MYINIIIKYMKSIESKETAAKEAISSFISNISISSNIILITSGGTSVPLEKNTVRSIENFSTGKRGSLCAEYFLKNDYIVIFFYRNTSLKPFLHRSCLDEYFHSDFDTNSYLNEFKTYRELYEKYTKSLLLISYSDLDYYLMMYEYISKQLSIFGKHSIIFLAAAVSDFYIPKDIISTNKIHSSGELTLKLSPVKKEIYKIKEEWNKEAMVITFKLETDEEILMAKAKAAIDNTKADVVIANLLQKRYDEVFFVTNSTETDAKILKGNARYIEENIVLNVISRHKEYMS